MVQASVPSFIHDQAICQQSLGLYNLFLMFDHLYWLTYHLWLTPPYSPISPFLRKQISGIILQFVLTSFENRSHYGGGIKPLTQKAY